MDTPLDSLEPESSSELTLLLANIGTALRELDGARFARDSESALRSMESALHTYGSVKHLLPRLNLSAEQRTVAERQLSMLRERIVSR
jgi:hypothetical protein